MKKYFKKVTDLILKNVTNKQDLANTELEIKSILLKLLQSEDSEILVNGSVNRKLSVFNRSRTIILIADMQNCLLRTVDGSIIFDVRISQTAAKTFYTMIEHERMKRFDSLMSEVDTIVRENLRSLMSKLYDEGHLK